MKQQRIVALDGLRGLAALTVVLFHVLTLDPSFLPVLRKPLALVPEAGALAPLGLPILHLSWAGREAVILFFALSGFALAQPFCHPRTAPTYSDFLVRRLYRIYLPFLMVVALGVGLWSLIGNLPVVRSGVIYVDQWSHAPTMTVVFKALLMENSSVMRVEPPLWSIAHEMRLSLVFPLLFFSLARWPVATFAAALAFSVAMEQVRHSLTGLLEAASQTGLYLYLFALGALLAIYRPWVERWVAALLLVAILLLALVTLALLESGLFLPFTNSRWAVGVGSVLLLGLVIGRASWRQAFEGPLLAWLGRISFSLYLTHYLVIHLVVKLLGNRVPVGGVMLVSLAAALPMAVVFHRLVEEPTHRLGRRWIAGEADPPPGRLFCNGHSMYPTLRAGDLLEYTTVSPERLRRGDVIIFPNPSLPDRLVVHRLRARRGDRLITQGDHNHLPDSWEVASDQVVGRVLYYHRGKHRRVLAGGLAAQLQGRVTVLSNRLWSFLLRKAAWLLAPLYHQLARRGVVLNLLGAVGYRPAPRVVRLSRDGQEYDWLMLGNRRIGWRVGDQARWRVRRPYRLLVEPSQVVEHERRDL
ncbi:exopolysaccharide production protein ExoZ [Gammaproteobacteria bacterium]